MISLLEYSPTSFTTSFTTRLLLQCCLVSSTSTLLMIHNVHPFSHILWHFNHPFKSLDVFLNLPFLSIFFMVQSFFVNTPVTTRLLPSDYSLSICFFWSWSSITPTSISLGEKQLFPWSYCSNQPFNFSYFSSNIYVASSKCLSFHHTKY